MRAKRLLAAVTWVLALATAASAQVTTGSIVGTVSDPQGQVVPGASVTIREVGKDTSTSIVSDAQRQLRGAISRAGHL